MCAFAATSLRVGDQPIHDCCQSKLTLLFFAFLIQPKGEKNIPKLRDRNKFQYNFFYPLDKMMKESSFVSLQCAKPHLREGS